jgi:hypothetical protein
MWSQFLLENFHFAVNLFAALAFFSIFWLYFDAWVDRKTLKEGLKIFGFLLLSLSFLAHAILVESPTLTVSLFSSGLIEQTAILMRNFGYLFLIVGLITDPLIPKPKLGALLITNFAFPYLTAPILAVTAAWLYLRRATIGLENHTKSVSLAFFLTALYELTAIPSLYINSTNVDIFRLVAPFGPIWLVSHLILFIGSAILIKWTFSYLLKRINTQLFIIFTTTTLSIFLLTTVSFTFLLLKNISDETLRRLGTDVSVLSYALDAKKSESLASASILAQNTAIIDAISTGNRQVLATSAEALLLSRKLSSVVILNETGQVLARGEERDRIGDSLSGDSLVKRALIGESVSSLTTKEAAIAPTVLVNSAVPIMSVDGKVIGVSLVALSLDNNFLDGIKKVTGLEVGIYGGEVLSATTISDIRGITRPIGIKNANKTISNNVLTKGEDFQGQISLLNTSYFAVYHPLKDADNAVVGMLLAGRPSGSIFATAGKSIELTFLITVLLIVLSILPSYTIARYITNQLK